MKASEKNQVVFTVSIIIGVLFFLMFIFFSLNMMDKEYEQMMSRAEFICWNNGYFNGVDELAKLGIGKYGFTCKGAAFEYVFAIGEGIIYGDLE